MARNRRGRPRHPDVLTPAEWRVLEELREGGTNAEIAARLGISGDAVKYHISNMLGKLALRDRRALAAWRPERRRGGLFAIPAALGALGRSVAWVGAGAAVAGGVAVVSVIVVIALVATQRDGDRPAVVEVPVAVTGQADPAATPVVPVPAAASTPTPAAPRTPSPTPTATPAPAPTPRPRASITAPPTPTPAPELAPGQELVFVGDVPEEDQAAVRDELGRVVAFFNDRFGIAVPDFTFYFGMDLGPVAERYRELHGREAPFDEGHGGGWALGLRDGTTEAYVGGQNRHRTAAVLAHEYYHLLQHHVVISLADGPRSAPAWLIEGTAAYADALYALREGDRQAEFLWEWEALVNPVPILNVIENHGTRWRELTGARPISVVLDPSYYPLAASAVAWLVAHAGDAGAHLRYWQQLAELEDSNAAFESAFGIAVDDFVQAFEAYRRESAQGLPEVRGTITDLSGRPVPGAHIAVRPAATGKITAESFDRISAFLNRDPISQRSTSSEDGSFAIPVLPQWGYGISLAWVVPATPQNPLTEIRFGLSVDPVTGAVNQCGALSFLDVGQDNVTGLDIHVSPDLLARTEQPQCGEGLPDSVALSGIMRGPDGQPAESIHVSAESDASAEGDESGGTTSWMKTGPDGRFTLAVQPGGVRLRVGGYDWPVGWYADGAWVGSEASATTIQVGAQGIEDIEIAIPAVISGTVTWPEPDPPGYQSVMVCAEPALQADPGCAPVYLSDALGRFALAVPTGPVSLRIWEHGGWVGWYGNGGVVTNEDERTVIQADQLHISGMEIKLPW